MILRIPKILFIISGLFLVVSCNPSGHSGQDDELKRREAAERAAVQSFEKISSDWEILISAYAGETNKLGRFSNIGFLPDPNNEYWRVYEKSEEFGKQYIESKTNIMDCPGGQIWINSYSIQEKTPSLKFPGPLECLQIFLKYGSQKESR